MSFDVDGIDFDRRQFGRAIRREMSPISVPHQTKDAPPPEPCPFTGTLADAIAAAVAAEARREAWKGKPLACLVPRDDAARKYRYGPTPEL